MICLRSVLWVALAVSVMMNVPAVSGYDAQAGQGVQLLVDDPRPVAKAIEILEARCGWVITYEDPPYVHESDVVDVTLEVRRDLDKFAEGKAPKVLIPRGGRLDISYTVSPDTSEPDDPGALIQTFLGVHAVSGNPGVFRLDQTGDMFHVIPAAVRSSNGQLVAQGSVLDATITLPEQERTGIEILEAICAAVSQATQTHVVVGMIPLNLFAQHRSRLGALNEMARDILVQVLASIEGKLSWQLFYDPGLRWYILNVHLIPEQ